MLLIVVDDEKAEDQQAGKNAAGDLRGGMEIHDRTGERREKENAGGENVPPTARGGIFGKGFGGEDELGSRPNGRGVHMRGSGRFFRSWQS